MELRLTDRTERLAAWLGGGQGEAVSEAAWGALQPWAQGLRDRLLLQASTRHGPAHTPGTDGQHGQAQCKE